MAEFTEYPVEVEVEEYIQRGKQVLVVPPQGPSPWELYVDGVVNQKGLRGGGGLVIVSLDRITIEKSLRLGFSATNNEAEYKALLIRIAMVQNMEGEAVKVFLDSRLIVGQVKGELEAMDLRM